MIIDYEGNKNSLVFGKTAEARIHHRLIIVFHLANWDCLKHKKATETSTSNSDVLPLSTCLLVLLEIDDCCR